jgi:hypothetical protein
MLRQLLAVSLLLVSALAHADDIDVIGRVVDAEVGSRGVTSGPGGPLVLLRETLPLPSADCRLLGSKASAISLASDSTDASGLYRLRVRDNADPRLWLVYAHPRYERTFEELLVKVGGPEQCCKRPDVTLRRIGERAKSPDEASNRITKHAGATVLLSSAELLDDVEARRSVTDQIVAVWASLEPSAATDKRLDATIRGLPGYLTLLRVPTPEWLAQMPEQSDRLRALAADRRARNEANRPVPTALRQTGLPLWAVILVLVGVTFAVNSVLSYYVKRLRQNPIDQRWLAVWARRAPSWLVTGVVFLVSYLLVVGLLLPLIWL